MADTSTIEWTDATWNPITGCTLVSSGCRHCYAATLAATRLRNHPSRKGLARINAAGEAKFTGEVRFNEQWLDQPLRWSRPRRIFVCAHGDLFHEAVPDEWIDAVFAVMALAPQHTFQVLTKRPERAREMLTAVRRPGLPERTLRHIHALARSRDEAMAAICRPITQLPNVWLGTSAEDQATAEARIPHLLYTPAAVRFASLEPLLGPVDPTEIAWQGRVPAAAVVLDSLRGIGGIDGPPGRLDLIIVGGESGPGARPMHPDWVRSLRDQCVSAGVPFFFKQWGEWAPSTPEEAVGNPRSGWRCLAGHPHIPKATELYPEAGAAFMAHHGKRHAGRLLDGRTWDQMPAPPRSDMGGGA